MELKSEEIAIFKCEICREVDSGRQFNAWGKLRTYFTCHYCGHKNYIDKLNLLFKTDDEHKVKNLLNEARGIK
jgi:hypothetical protein